MSAYCWFDYSTVILTGASSGIGKDLALRLIKDHGCNMNRQSTPFLNEAD